MDLNEWNIGWSVGFGLTAIIITLGNLLTIGIFLKRKLRRRRHFLLISLAVADLLAGLFAVPLYIAIGIDEGNLLKIFLFQCVDMFTGLTSVFTLAMVSLERMYAIGWPLHHRQRSVGLYIFFIATPWVLGTTGAIARVLLQFYVIRILDFVIYILVFLVFPLLLTCVAYCITWKKRSLPCLNPQQATRDAKLAKTLLLITGAFIMTWLPFQIINIVLYFCPSCRVLPYAVVHFMKLFQFSNSFINVIIYPLRILKFREAIIEVLQNCASSPRGRRQRYRESSGLDSRKTKSLRLRARESRHS